MAVGANSRLASLVLGAVVFILIVAFLNPTPDPRSPKDRAPGHLVEPTDRNVHPHASVLDGPVVMPTLGNDTIKAELGRSTWRLLHTMMARFPEEPTPDEQDTLRSFIYLFSRLYPCGECAQHFQHMLKSYPPQVSSRNAAAAWACDVHNKVNKKLRKPIFDCANIGDFYDCGCADDGTGTNPHGKSRHSADKANQQAGNKIDGDSSSSEPFSIHPEPLWVETGNQ
ncbi:hypothetical protein KEM56_001842 [Ascosphaera pollenicola]|nr:hypothetical protein KEM56_001842 [Ascosphaera pollenicola]